MSTEQMGTYEKIYFALWELGQRYGNFVQFRVIGRSHDDRMIPMLEIGHGDSCIFCVGGFSGTDGKMSDMLTLAAAEYCKTYECRWMIQDLNKFRTVVAEKEIL